MLFESERLSVCRATPADVDALLPIYGDPETVRHYNQGQPWTRAQVERLVAHFAPTDPPKALTTPGVVRLKPAGEVVGLGGVYDALAEMDEAELAFIFSKAHWGKGLATELAMAALAEAFTHPEIGSIYATAKPANVVSVRVLEKAGMHRIEYLPDRDRLLYRICRPRHP